MRINNKQPIGFEDCLICGLFCRGRALEAFGSKSKYSHGFGEKNTERIETNSCLY